MKKCLLLVSLVAALPLGSCSMVGIGSPSVAPLVESDPLGVVVHQLSNGMTVMLSPNREEPRISTQITVRTGSAKDPADATGLAHYLEHMLFKGTTELGTIDWEAEKPHLDAITALYDELFETTDPARRAELYAQIDSHNVEASKYSVPNEFDQLYDNIGGTALNAFTSNDQTTYVVDIPANRLELWAEIEAHRMTEPVFRLFQTEIETVYEEKNRTLDNKARATYSALLASAFPDHPYGTQSTIGTVEHLKNPSIRKMYEYFRRWYVPRNMCISLAGDFEPAEAIAILERHFGAWEDRSFPDDPPMPRDLDPGRHFTEVKFDAEEQVMIAFRTVPPGHPDKDALVLCDMMLDNGNTGLINVNVTQQQLVQSAGSSPQFMAQGGMQLLFGVAKQGQSLDEVERILLDQIERLKAGEFTDEDLAAVVTDFEISEKRSREDNDSRVSEMTGAFVDRTPWEDVVAELDRYRALDREAVVAAANEYFGDTYVAVHRVRGEPDLPEIPKPEFTPVEVSKERRSAIFQEWLARDAAPIEPRWVVEGRDYERLEVDFGVVYAGPNPANDLFDLTFHFPVGADHDPRLEVAPSVFAYAGAGDRDVSEYQRELYRLGSTITVSSDVDETTVTLSGLDANFEATVDLMVDHLSRPKGIDQTMVDRFAARVVGLRQSQMGEPEVVSDALVAYAMRGAESPLLTGLTNAQVEALRAEDVTQAVQSVWSYPRTITYVGPRTASEVAVAVPVRLDGLTELRAAPPRKALTYVQPTEDRILFVDEPTAQSQVNLLAPDGLYDPALVPLSKTYSEYMSGSMGSVVFQEVREARALAYSAWAAHQTPGWKGDMMHLRGVLGTQVDKTHEAIEVLLGLLRDIPASETRFSQVQRAIDEGYRTGRVGFRRVPDVALVWERLGLDGDPRAWNREQIQSMTLDALNEFGDRFGSRPFTITIVGDAERIDMERLAEFGRIERIQPEQLFNWDDAE